MAVTAKVYGLGLENFVRKRVDWISDTIKCMLVTSTYTPNQDTNQYVSAVTGEVASGNGYTTGGLTLTGKTVTYDTTTNTLKLSATSPSWANSTITARYGVIYMDTGTAGTSPLISYLDLGQDYTSSAGPFTLTVPSTGILTLAAA